MVARAGSLHLRGLARAGRFGPHKDAQRRRLLRIAEQDSSRSTAYGPVADVVADLYGSDG